MCKVLIIPAIKKHRLKETNILLRAMGVSMSKGNSDGLGYAAINERGELFGERWFVNNEAFKPVQTAKTPDHSDMKGVAEKMVGQFGKALKSYKSDGWKKQEETSRYNKFGNDNMDDAVAITLHTRAATCDRNLMNVHPFVDAELDTSVIHNGVINNSKDFDLKLSTCDSESILISYLRNGVNKDINEVQKMVDELSGYYACGVFSRDAEGTRILDVFKYNNNNLSICYIYELETYVLTSSDVELKEVCRALGFSHDGVQDVESDFITRINPFTGEIIGQVSFKKNYAANSYNYPSKYKDYEHWNNKSNVVTNIEKFRKQRTEKKDDIIDPKLAAMWGLESSIRELGEREVEEHQSIVGWD